MANVVVVQHCPLVPLCSVKLNIADVFSRPDEVKVGNRLSRRYQWRSVSPTSTFSPLRRRLDARPEVAWGSSTVNSHPNYTMGAIVDVAGDGESLILWATRVRSEMSVLLCYVSKATSRTHERRRPHPCPMQGQRRSPPNHCR